MLARFHEFHPLSLDYMRRAVGPAPPRPMRVHVRSQRGGGDRWPLVVVVERAIGLRFCGSLGRVLMRFPNGE